jgi:deoxyribonuclease-4
VISTAKRLLFGTAGVPHSSDLASTLSGIKQTAAVGLDCLEVEFVRGVKMGDDTAKAVAKKAAELGVALSAHAPYYVNLNSPEEGKRLSSQKYILSAARTAMILGARSLVFHAGYYGFTKPEEAYETVKKALKEILSILKSERNTVTLRIETMGKTSQFGTLDEVLFLCRELEGLGPCLDFCHMHARERFSRYEDFDRVVKKLRKKLGQAALNDVHFHIAGVMYGNKGELKHLNLRDSDFRYDDWIQALKEHSVKGMVICESPNLETDALMLKNLYSQSEWKK